jgi:hypothetical protein
MILKHIWQQSDLQWHKINIESIKIAHFLNKIIREHTDVLNRLVRLFPQIEQYIVMATGGGNEPQVYPAVVCDCSNMTTVPNVYVVLVICDSG